MSEKADAWMPLWIGAYTADTTHLTNTQHGAYFLLIIAYWRRGVPLPDNDADLADFAKATPRQWQAMRSRIAQFFEVKDGLWRHKRIDQELADAVARKQKAVSRASAAAQARWGRAGGHASGNAESIPQALPEQCPPPTPTPTPENGGVDARTREERATQLAFGLRRIGVNVTSANPCLRQWLEDGYTAEDIHAALVIARISKPEPANMPAKYLDTVLRNLPAGIPTSPSGKCSPAAPGPRLEAKRNLHDERAQTIASLTGAAFPGGRAPLTLDGE